MNNTDNRKIWEEGYSNGFSIAENVFLESRICLGDKIPREFDWVGYGVLEEDNWVDFFVGLACDVESEHFRQYSPFEFFAKWLNDIKEEKPYDPWEIYSHAVREGAIAAVKKFDPPEREV